jgi:hypothetical protein
LTRVGAPVRRAKEDFGDKVKAHVQYKIDGVRIPGVTTVLGVLSKPALVSWANRKGLEGIDTSKYRDETAAIGTLAHYFIVCELAGEAPDTSDYTPQQIERAQWSLRSFHAWQKRHTLEPILVEAPLVSQEHRYGGTIDFYGEIDGALALLDFKTSAGIYAEHRIQVSAYVRLLREHGKRLQEVRVLRIGRTEDEGFSEHILGIGELKAGWEIFQACLVVHSLMPKMKGAA